MKVLLQDDSLVNLAFILCEQVLGDRKHVPEPEGDTDGLQHQLPLSIPMLNILQIEWAKPRWSHRRAQMVAGV